MPRPLRAIQAGVIYHVLNRGNGQATIFHKPADFQAFVDVLVKALTRFKVDLLCWCLMGNHWHLVLRPRVAGQLQAFMQWITLTHVRRHHAHYGRPSGHLYQGRYKHFAVEKEAYFLTLCRYVEANPLRAGMVRRAQDWKWSSLHQRIAGNSEPRLSDWPVDRPAQWVRVVNDAMEESEMRRVRQSIARGRPLGSRKWVQQVAAKLGLVQSLRERGRPRKAMEELSERQRQRRRREIGHKGV